VPAELRTPRHGQDDDGERDRDGSPRERPAVRTLAYPRHEIRFRREGQLASELL
jgi:hypothetical protein